MTSDELSYIAGFFDGEGSITIHENGKPSPRGKVPNHTLQVSIGNTDPRVLGWIHRNFRGSLIVRKTVKPNHRQVTQWTIRAAAALPFLEAIKPFVRMKIEQVNLAIAFQKTKYRHNTPVAHEEVVWREGQRQLIRELNGRGATNRQKEGT